MLYRFGSTGVVQVLSRAAEVLGLVPVFPVRNIHSFGSGMCFQSPNHLPWAMRAETCLVAQCVPKIGNTDPGSTSGSAGDNAVFRDCVLVKKGTTVRECARKIMGDAPLAYVEGAGGVRVSEDEVITLGKNDVSIKLICMFTTSESDQSRNRCCHLKLVDSSICMPRLPLPCL